MLDILDTLVIYRGPIFAVEIVQPVSVHVTEYLRMRPGNRDVVNKDIEAPVAAQSQRRTPNGDGLHRIGFAENKQERPGCTRVQDHLMGR